MRASNVANPGDPKRHAPALPCPRPAAGVAQSGQLAAAQQTIDAELAALERDGVGNPAQRAEAWLAAGEVLLAAGQPAAAAGHAQRAMDAWTRAARDPEASAKVGQARWLLARSLATQGDDTAARAQAARAAQALTRGAGPDHRLAVEARSLAARR